MPEDLRPSAKKVQDAVRELGFDFQVKEMPGSTRTSIEAAEAVGCHVSRIAKSLVFKGAKTGVPLLVIASGSNLVDEKKLANLIGEKIKRANAEYVREQTGFAIGGIPPVAHIKPIRTLIDEDLLQYDRIWAAAGTPHAVFPLTPRELVQMTKGEVADTKK